MKRYLPLLLILTVLGTTPSCKMFGENPTPPTKLERAIFDVVTNYVTITRTNEVVVPKVVEVIVQTTNTQNQTILATNLVNLFVTNPVTVLVTNEQYDLIPKESTRTIVSGAGAVSNIAIPGSGGIITAGVMAVLGIWAQWRSVKRQATSVTLVQQLETVREFIKTLPSGEKYDDAITRWLSDHQVETGVAKQVIDILTKETSTDQARGAAIDIKAKVLPT